MKETITRGYTSSEKLKELKKKWHPGRNFAFDEDSKRVYCKVCDFKSEYGPLKKYLE